MLFVKGNEETLKHKDQTIKSDLTCQRPSPDCYDMMKQSTRYGLQDLRSQEARSSWDPSSDSKSHGEICSNIVDYRISGLRLPALAQLNATRKIKKLIEKFENHQHKESFLQDMSQMHCYRREEQVQIVLKLI